MDHALCCLVACMLTGSVNELVVIGCMNIMQFYERGEVKINFCSILSLIDIDLLEQIYLRFVFVLSIICYRILSSH